MSKSDFVEQITFERRNKAQFENNRLYESLWRELKMIVRYNVCNSPEKAL